MADFSKIICMDVDGVLVNPTEMFLQQLNDAEGTKYAVEDVTTFEYKEIAKFKSGHLDILYKMWENPNLYDGLEAEPGVVEALEELRTFTRVIACTSPTIGHVDSKYRWLTGHCGFTKDDIAIVKDKSLVQGALLVDDHIENLKTFGGERICFARPWNADWDPSMGLRTNDWPKIVKAARAIIEK